MIVEIALRERQGSNLRYRIFSPALYQLSYSRMWRARMDSNHRPAVLEAAALPG